MNVRYGSERIARGLLHFAAGKAFSATCGLLAMVLVVRLLPVEDFADYSVLVALIEVVTALAGLGISHALLRYVPELYAKQYVVALRRLILTAVALRLSALLLVVLIAWVVAPAGAPLIGMADAIGAARLYLMVVVFRTASHFLSQILESTLHQGYAQIGFSLAALARMVGMLYLLNNGGARLVDVIWVEIVSDLLCLVIMLTGVFRVIWASTSFQPPSDDQSWISRTWRQITRFALSGYLQHLVGLPFGGNTNRLVGGALFANVTMASFGFAHSLYEYLKRYLPAQLLVGLVRPVVVARYSDGRDFSSAVTTCEGIALVNAALLGAMFSLLLVGGADALAWISSGKYGSDAALLLGALLIVVFLETRRLILEMLVQTVDHYELLIPANLFLSASIIPAVVAYPTAGAIGFPLANAAALALSNYWVRKRLNRLGFQMDSRWSPVLKLALLCCLCIALGKILIVGGLHWTLVMAVTFAVNILGAWYLCQPQFRSFIADFIGIENG